MIRALKGNKLFDEARDQYRPDLMFPRGLKKSAETKLTKKTTNPKPRSARPKKKLKTRVTGPSLFGCGPELICTVGM